MEDKNREDDTTVSVEEKRVEDTESSSVENAENKRDRPSAQKTKGKGTLIVTIILVIVISLGLIFVLERDGRINTGLFSSVIENMNTKTPVAKVNGEMIAKSEFNSEVEQFAKISRLQGADYSSEQALASFREQALETLINTELLRQAALEKGVDASKEDVDAKINEIKDEVGGEEALVVTMAEFGVTEKSLRRDIENGILIQKLVIGVDEIEVTEDEVNVFYAQTGGVEAGVPPLEDVREQVVQQIRYEKEQQKIGIYIKDLREQAEIEILI